MSDFIWYCGEHLKSFIVMGQCHCSMGNILHFSTDPYVCHDILTLLHEYFIVRVLMLASNLFFTNSWFYECHFMWLFLLFLLLDCEIKTVHMCIQQEFNDHQPKYFTKKNHTLMKPIELNVCDYSHCSPKSICFFKWRWIHFTRYRL